MQSEKNTDIFNFFSSLKRRKEAKEETKAEIEETQAPINLIPEVKEEDILALFDYDCVLNVE